VTLDAEDHLKRGIERRCRKRHVGILLAAQLRRSAVGDGKREQQAVEIADFVDC